MTISLFSRREQKAAKAIDELVTFIRRYCKTTDNVELFEHWTRTLTGKNVLGGVVLAVDEADFHIINYALSHQQTPLPTLVAGITQKTSYMDSEMDSLARLIRNETRVVPLNHFLAYRTEYERAQLMKDRFRKAARYKITRFDLSTKEGIIVHQLGG